MTTHVREVCQKVCINALNQIVLLSAFFNALCGGVGYMGEELDGRSGMCYQTVE